MITKSNFPIKAYLIAILIVIFIMCTVEQIYLNYYEIVPNQIYFDNITNNAEYKPCCDSIYLEMCNEYKRQNNLTFDCFQKGYKIKQLDQGEKNEKNQKGKNKDKN